MRWRLKSPASLLFPQPFVQVKENIKVPRHWPLRVIHRCPVNSTHKRPMTRNMFPFDDVTIYCLVATQVSHSCKFSSLCRLVCFSFLELVSTVYKNNIFVAFQMIRSSDIDVHDICWAKHSTSGTSTTSIGTHPRESSFSPCGSRASHTLLVGAGNFRLHVWETLVWGRAAPSSLSCSTLVRIMACHLFGTKPLSELMLYCC